MLIRPTFAAKLPLRAHPDQHHARRFHIGRRRKCNRRQLELDRLVVGAEHARLARRVDRINRRVAAHRRVELACERRSRRAEFQVAAFGRARVGQFRESADRARLVDSFDLARPFDTACRGEHEHISLVRSESRRTDCDAGRILDLGLVRQRRHLAAEGDRVNATRLVRHHHRAVIVLQKVRRDEARRLQRLDLERNFHVESRARCARDRVGQTRHRGDCQHCDAQCNAED